MNRILSLMLLLLCPLAARAANLASGEWFIDGDPGPGAGTAFAVAEAETHSGSVTIPAAALDGLAPGYHLLGVRMRDDQNDGEWGHVVWRAFHKEEAPPSERQLATGEWFIDEDPGAGHGTPIALPAAASATVSPQIPASVLDGLAEGYHLLGVRTRDDVNRWGHTVWRAFHIDRTFGLAPDIVAVDYRILRGGQQVFQGTAPASPSGTPVNLTVAHGTQALLLDAAHTVQAIPIDALGRRGHAAYADFSVQHVASPPSVTTDSVDSITANSAIVGGNVTDDGGASVTERGVVYSATPNPNIATGTKVPSGSGLGDFSCPLTGLSPGVTWYARAYATNSGGTGYGNGVTFTTDTNVVFESGVATFSRGILPGDRHRFKFSLDGPRHVSLSTAGGAALRAELRDPQGNVVDTFSGDGDFAFDQLLLAGEYELDVFRLPGGGDEQPYDLTIDASVVAMAQPEVVLTPTSLVSIKARPVTGRVRISNRGSLPESLSVRAGGGDGFFAVSYFAPDNVTAALLVGTHRTPVLVDGGDESAVRVSVVPNKRKLTKKRGRRTTILKKSINLPIRATSTSDPSNQGGASLRVWTR